MTIDTTKLRELAQTEWASATGKWALLNVAADEIDRLRTIEAAARNLAKVKGRHHAEIAMNRLQATLAASE